MIDRDSIQEIIQALSKNKLRTALTAFGVFWGIFMLIFMMGSGKGLENGAKGSFGNFGSNAMFLWTNRTAKPYKGLPVGRYFNLNNDDVPSLRKNVQNIDLLCPRIQLGGYNSDNNVVRGKYTGAFQIYGDIPEIFEIESKKITEGRFLNQNDIHDKRKVCVIGKRVKEVLFEKEEEAIGEYIRIQGIYFMVIGVFDSKVSGNRSERDTENIYVPFSTAQQAFNMGDRIGWFCITAKPNVLISEIEPEILAVLAANHSVDPTDTRAFGFWNSEKEFLKMNNLFIGINFLIWIVGIGTLMAGVIGVSNIMLVVVNERTKEIGIRKAIGAPPAKIISQIIFESTLLTGIAGYLGLVFGVVIIESINKVLPGDSGMFRNPEIDFSLAIWASIILIISGAFAGLIPAQKAASINPVIALRNDT